ncbi:MAG: hypothetical protein ABIO72_00865 [Patescibacteria group bacterium]
MPEAMRAPSPDRNQRSSRRAIPDLKLVPPPPPPPDYFASDEFSADVDQALGKPTPEQVAHKALQEEETAERDAMQARLRNSMSKMHAKYRSIKPDELDDLDADSAVESARKVEQIRNEPKVATKETATPPRMLSAQELLVEVEETAKSDDELVQIQREKMKRVPEPSLRERARRFSEENPQSKEFSVVEEEEVKPEPVREARPSLKNKVVEFQRGFQRSQERSGLQQRIKQLQHELRVENAKEGSLQGQLNALRSKRGLKTRFKDWVLSLTKNDNEPVVSTDPEIAKREEKLAEIQSGQRELTEKIQEAQSKLGLQGTPGRPRMFPATAQRVLDTEEMISNYGDNRGRSEQDAERAYGIPPEIVEEEIDQKEAAVEQVEASKATEDPAIELTEEEYDTTPTIETNEEPVAKKIKKPARRLKPADAPAAELKRLPTYRVKEAAPRMEVVTPRDVETVMQEANLSAKDLWNDLNQNFQKDNNSADFAGKEYPVTAYLFAVAKWYEAKRADDTKKRNAVAKDIIAMRKQYKFKNVKIDTLMGNEA